MKPMLTAMRNACETHSGTDAKRNAERYAQTYRQTYRQGSYVDRRILQLSYARENPAQ